MTEFSFKSCKELHAPAFVVAVSNKGAPRLVYANDLCLDAFALPEIAVVNRALDEIFDPRGAARLADCVRNGPVQNTENETPGRIIATVPGRSFLVTVSPLETPPGHVLCTCYEAISERDPQSPVAQSVQDLEQAEQFVALAAHDLRAPMRNISQLAEMLRNCLGPIAPGPENLLGMIEDVATKSDAMVADILDTMQTIHAPSEVSAFDIGLMCRNLCDVLDPLGLHHVHWPEAMVEADRVVMQTALRNLLDNALKHGGKSAMSVRISLETAPEGQVRLRVSDNGLGFDLHDLAQWKHTDTAGGSGYGLAALSRLITSRGGTITSEAGAASDGGCVEFQLPGRILNVQIRGRRPRIHQRARQNPPGAIGMADKD